MRRRPAASHSTREGQDGKRGPRKRQADGKTNAFGAARSKKPAFAKAANPKAAKPPARKSPPPPPEKTSAFEGERIAKVMARAGACSRRDAEAWIADGRVAVNGRVLTSPAFNVREGDAIAIDGKPMQGRERTRLFLFHKPAGLVTSAKDPEGRETVFAYLDARRPDLPRLVSVGRLDINTEGLLLLTNDGGLARTLELPATGWTRRYRVRVHGEVDQARLDTLKDGVTVDGVAYAPIESSLDRTQGANAWLTMGLTEGKNREIKRVLEHLGLDVARLIRVSYGPFQLGDLAEGAVEEVRLKVLREQLGKTLAEFAGVDFSSPLREDMTPAQAQEARERAQKRSRKHVSTLRRERDEKAASGPRARIERSATADRRGRAVAVERVVVKGAKAEAPETRNARRFAKMRGDERPRAPREETRGPRKESRGRDGGRRAREAGGSDVGDGRRRERDDRGAFAKPAARRTGGSRFARGEAGASRSNGEFRAKKFGREDRRENAQRPRPPSGDKPRGPRAPRGGGKSSGKPGGPRKPRSGR
jgi:23S rRNA pseudouridine2605 synthase